MPALSKAEICELIPHRDPFLLLDEIVDVSETKIHARKSISPEMDVFRGHYPGQPILPGVLILEASMQAGAVLIARLPGGAVQAGQVPVATRINNVKFKQMVRPGSVLDIHVELTEHLANAFYLAAKVQVDGKTAVTFDFACAAAAAAR